MYCVWNLPYKFTLVIVEHDIKHPGKDGYHKRQGRDKMCEGKAVQGKRCVRDKPREGRDAQGKRCVRDKPCEGRDV